LLGDKQFGFWPRHSTTLQLARLVERVNRNFDERRLTSAVFLDVAKALNTIWVKGLLYKLIVLNFPSYLVKTTSSYCDCQMFQMTFQSATSTCHGWCGLGWTCPPVPFNLYVNDIPTPSRHVELAQYTDNTALEATSHSRSLLVGYLEAFLSVIWRPISLDWRAGYGIGGLPSMSQRALLCSLLRLRDAFKNPEQCNFSESQYNGSKQHGILGWPLILSLPGQWTSTRWERRQQKDWVCLAPSLTGEVACPSETVCCSTSSSSVLWWITHVWGPLPAAMSGSCKCYNPSVFTLQLTHLGTLVTGKFTRILGFHSSLTTSEHWLRVQLKVS
jgi:hypothetical protein